ncbi:restriction endonuclease subunit S [Cutibacterium avidum]|uniref:restriction endonuclease subunit S n=1 Tax=Cutibacterium avidum TaxID=33010 RepID=UPI00254D5335|nr:restriction endonuclease subunit S [Cutibacterium avidum]MDK7358279.1 restriction endonuclease subunit S [Cutibacterium avidum]MDK7371987.1 restriction endonuclease subunit S [Cutibacterium avidum]
MWPAVRLGDVTTKIRSGATPRGGASGYTNSRIALIRSQNVLDNSMTHEGLAHISDEAAMKLANASVEKDDVLLNITGDSVARCCVMEEAFLPARVNQHVSIIRTESQLDPRFLQRALVNPEMKNHLLTISSGGTRNALTKSMLENLEVPLPPLPEQQAIAEVLGALDDKIAANRALVATADDLATAIYRRESSTTAPLSSLAKFVNGRNFTKDASGTGRAVIRIAELNSGIGDSTVFNDVGALPQNVAGPGDILFAWSGSLTLKRWTAEEGLVNQHIFKVIPNSDVPQWLVYQAIRHALPDFKAIAADKATTMGHIQRHHLDAKVPIPTTSQTVPLDPLMGGLWQMALAAEVESATLAALRDTLLPALMDGTLRVKDAERTVSEAL